MTKYADRAHPPCRRVQVIGNGVLLRAPARDLPRAARFLVSGRIAPSKRLETIIEAFRLFSANFPEARLDVVGQAEARHRDYLEILLSAAGGLAVTFRGARPELDFLDEPWTAAVVLGTKQGCPNAVLEAMASGIAVVANASGGTGELIRHGETGWLLSEACSSAELAQALAEAAGDARRARRLGEAARAHVARNCGIAEMALRYLSIFDPGASVASEPQETPHGLHRLHPA